MNHTITRVGENITHKGQRQRQGQYAHKGKRETIGEAESPGGQRSRSKTSGIRQQQPGETEVCGRPMVLYRKARVKIEDKEKLGRQRGDERKRYHRKHKPHPLLFQVIFGVQCLLGPIVVCSLLLPCEQRAENTHCK